MIRPIVKDHHLAVCFAVPPASRILDEQYRDDPLHPPLFTRSELKAPRLRLLTSERIACLTHKTNIMLAATSGTHCGPNVSLIRVKLNSSRLSQLFEGQCSITINSHCPYRFLWLSKISTSSGRSPCSQARRGTTPMRLTHRSAQKAGFKPSGGFGNLGQRPLPDVLYATLCRALLSRLARSPDPNEVVGHPVLRKGTESLEQLGQQSVYDRPS